MELSKGLQEAIKLEGRGAAAMGVKRAMCPYPKDNNAYFYWHTGWCDYHREQGTLKEEEEQGTKPKTAQARKTGARRLPKPNLRTHTKKRKNA